MKSAGVELHQEQLEVHRDPNPMHEESKEEEQMCCDGKRTAAEHRKESPDGKCCSDS